MPGGEDWVKLATFDTARLLPCGSQPPQGRAGNLPAEHHPRHSDGAPPPPPPPQGVLSPYLFLRGLPNSRAGVRCVSGGVGAHGAPRWSPQRAASFHPQHRACCAAWGDVWRQRTHTSCCDAGGPADHVLSFCDWTWFHPSRGGGGSCNSASTTTSTRGRSVYLDNSRAATCLRSPSRNNNNTDDDKNNNRLALAEEEEPEKADNGDGGEWRIAGGGGLARASSESSESLMSLTASLSSSSLMSLAEDGE